MSELQRHVEAYGPVAGAKIYHMLKSRAAYKGVSTRRRHQVAAATGVPSRPVRPGAAVQPMLPIVEGL